MPVNWLVSIQAGYLISNVLRLTQWVGADANGPDPQLQAYLVSQRCEHAGVACIASRVQQMRMYVLDSVLCGLAWDCAVC